MALRTPGRRAGSGIALRQVKRANANKTARNLAVSLNLTSMVDFLSVLVIFLLMNFSADGDLNQNAADVTPPEADYSAEIKRMPVITISPVNITFQGKTVESSTAVLNGEEGYPLPNLVKALKREEDVFKTLRPGEPFPGEVMIQAHEELPYKLVRRVFAAASTAGYPNISYQVRVGSPQD